MAINDQVRTDRGTVRDVSEGRDESLAEIANDEISESAVTQHEAALTIGGGNLKVVEGTVNAGHSSFTGANNAEKVDAAIQFANTNSHPYVLVPESLIPYDPTAMPNGHLDAVKIVREGGDPSVYDVVAYGAALDDSTDDGPAARACLSAAEANGGTMVVRGGTAAMSLDGANAWCLRVTASDVTIRIAEDSALKLADSQISGSETANIIRIGDGTTAVSNVSILGPGTIDGNKANNSSAGLVGQALIYGTGPITEITIRGVEVQNGTRGGINFLGESNMNRGEYARVLECDVHDCDEGIKWELIDYFWCVGNRVTSIQEQDAIEPIDCSHFWVLDNHCESHSSNQAIDVFTTATANIEHGVISGNTIRGPSGAGITINNGGPSEARDIVVANNVVDLAGDTGSVCLHVGQSGAVCKRISFVGNETTGGKDGLVIGSGAQDVAAFGNVLGSANEMGIRVLSGAADTLLFGNACSGCGSDGINVHADDVVVVGNAARNNSTVGIRFLTATGTIQRFVVLGNKASDNTYGFQFKNVDDAQIVGNQAHDNSTANFLLQGTNSGLQCRANLGLVSENNGTATVASGTTSISVNHGLGLTPDIQDISVTPTNDPTNDVGNFWISGVGATSFTINVGSDPGSGGATFAWTAQIL